MPEPGNLGRKMLARGRKGTASVCARDKLWWRTGRTGAVQRTHRLIYVWTSCWQPGRVFAADLDLIHFRVNRNSKKTFEAPHSKCFTMFTKSHLSFLQGQQIKRDVLDTKTLKISWGETVGTYICFPYEWKLGTFLAFCHSNQSITLYLYTLYYRSFIFSKKKEKMCPFSRVSGLFRSAASTGLIFAFHFQMLDKRA